MGKIKRSIKEHQGKDILTIIIVILVAFGSFGLGRLSKNNSNSGIKIEYPDQSASAVSSIEPSTYSSNLTQEPQNQAINTLGQGKATTQASAATGKVFFASKIGNKYYTIGCSGGKTLKPENKIYFTTEQEAIRAGYTKSASCK